MYKIVVIITVTAFIQLSQAAEIKITEAWVNAFSPTNKIVAGYLTITNTREHSIQLSAAESPVFEKIEFHKTSIKNDIVSMQRKTFIEIPARTSLELKPGNYHLMMFNPTIPLEPDIIVNLILKFTSEYSKIVEKKYIKATIKN